MSITFDRSLVTGNELIDTQHRELIIRITIFPRRKRSRKRAGIRSFRPTTGSMKNLSGPWRNCGSCWRKRKDRVRPSWRL